MIHYHGLPILPTECANVVIKGGHAFVSVAYPKQLYLETEVCQSFAADNGAFSAWKSGKPIRDWNPYMKWISNISKFPNFDFAVIPDKVDGGEEDNDDLIIMWNEFFTSSIDQQKGAPVWHLHETLERLEKLICNHTRVCLGSSGDYKTIGTRLWWSRMIQAFKIICGKDNLPKTKIHGLRMLDPKVFTFFPLSSADSTNIAISIGFDSKWQGTYTPMSKMARAMVLRDRVESQAGATHFSSRAVYSNQIDIDNEGQ